MLHGIAAGRCFLWLLLHGAARHGKIFPEKLKMGISSHAWLRRVCEGSSSNMVEPADLRRDYVVTFVYLSAWGEGARQRRTGLSNVFGLAGVPILRPHRTINPNFPQRLPIRIQSLSKGGTLKYRASWSLGCGWNWHAKDWRQRTGPVSWRWQLSRHHWAVGFFNVLKVLKSPGRSRGASFTGSRMVPDGSFFFYNFLIWPSCSLFRCLHLGAQKNPKDVEVAVWRNFASDVWRVSLFVNNTTEDDRQSKSLLPRQKSAAKIEMQLRKLREKVNDFNKSSAALPASITVAFMALPELFRQVFG